MSWKASEMTANVSWKDITPGCNIFEGGTSAAVEKGTDCLLSIMERSKGKGNTAW